MNLYEFVTQLNIVRMTTAKADVILDGNTYTSTAMKRSKYTLDSVLRKNNIDIMFPGNNEFATNFLHPTTEKLQVAISSLSGVTFYRGRLIMVDYLDKEKRIILRFEPIIRMSRRVLGERRLFQVHCPYVVYGDQCDAQRVGHRFIVESVINNRAMVVKHSFNIRNYSSFQADERFNVFPNSYAVANFRSGRSYHRSDLVNGGRFAGGLINNRMRVGDPGFKQWWITRVESPEIHDEATGNSISFVLYTSTPHDLEVNTDVVLYFGCKQTESDCRDTHDNIKNYGGFPTMKRISPFDGGLRT